MKCPACGAQNIQGADDCESCQTPLTDIPALAPKKGMERRIIEGALTDIPPRRALTVSPGDDLAKAVEAMREGKMGCVLVVEGAELVGILSERELAFKVPESANLQKTLVKDVMRANPTVLKEDGQVADAFHRMAMSKVRHVPVQFSDGSYAVVSARDLLRYLCK